MEKENGQDGFPSCPFIRNFRFVRYIRFFSYFNAKAVPPMPISS